MTDFISKLRPFAADLANLCHLKDSRIPDSEEATELSEWDSKGKFYRKLAGRANTGRAAALLEIAPSLSALQASALITHS